MICYKHAFNTLYRLSLLSTFIFFFNDTATTEIYTLSLHDALPICQPAPRPKSSLPSERRSSVATSLASTTGWRSEEHTSELQSPCNLVCRLLLEKKKKIKCQTVTDDMKD